MTRAFLATATLLLLAIPASADDKSEPPQPPPTSVVARVADGKLVIEQVVMVTAYRQEARTQTVINNGKPVQVTYVVMVPFTQAERRGFDTTDVEVYDPEGKKVDPEKLPDLLKKETPGRLTADKKLRLLEGIKIRIHPSEPEKDKP
jgi:hypothetical protein